MTPRQFQPYALAWKDKEDRENYRFGTISQVVRWFAGDKDAGALDLFKPAKVVKEKHKSTVTAAQRKATWDAYFEAQKASSSLSTR